MLYIQNINAMKKLFLLTLVLFVASLQTGFAQQEKNAPRTEYAISLSDNAIQLAPGETKQVTITILRSKSFSRSQAELGLSSALPEGVTVTFEPSKGLFESSVATISASQEVKAGLYQVILKSTLANKTKGSIIKLTINNSLSKDALTVN
jgi:hypothetical protein